MTERSVLKRNLTLGAGLLGLGAVIGVVFLSNPVDAQETQSAAPSIENLSPVQATGPTEARPQLMAPSPNLIQQLSFADLVEEVSPAVVSIRTEADVSVRSRTMLPPGFERMLPPEFRGRDFGDFGKDEGEEGDDETVRQALGEGSGFFIDDQGHIVTNNHVINGADAITVVLNDGQEVTATLVGTDPSTDLAVLKVEPSAAQRYVRFSTEADLRVGDYVLAVGNPFGLGGSVTSGIVSAIGRENRISNQPYADFIQIDASINRGNSGGPTFDLQGNVVGVNTAIISPTGGNVGIGLAVPADVAINVVNQLIEHGAVTRGWLGVSIRDLDELLASAVGLSEPKGALVAGVQPDSPAARAGVLDGDVILDFNGIEIVSSAQLTRTVGSIPPGETVVANVLRDGEERTLNVTLSRRDPLEAREAGADDDEPQEEVTDEVEMDLGVAFSSLNPQSRSQLGLGSDVQGALVTRVERTSDAYSAGIREGMVITRADNVSVEGPSDIERAVRAAEERGKEAVLIRVEIARSGSSFLALPIAGTGRG